MFVVQPEFLSEFSQGCFSVNSERTIGVTNHIAVLFGHMIVHDLGDHIIKCHEAERGAVLIDDKARMHPVPFELL
mgnify:CR=1 FL=1